MKQSYIGHPNGRDPAGGFRFYIQIDNVDMAEFLECSGLGMEREIKQVQEGGVKIFYR